MPFQLKSYLLVEILPFWPFLLVLEFLNRKLATNQWDPLSQHLLEQQALNTFLYLCGKWKIGYVKAYAPMHFQLFFQRLASQQ